MVPILGVALLLAALALLVFSALVAFVAARQGEPVLSRVGRRAFYAATGAIVAASVLLLLAFWGDDFRLAYVTEHSQRALELPLKLAGFYGGQEGSLLYWTLVLCLIASLSIAAAARSDAQLAAYAQGTIALVAAFFAFALVFVASPFSMLATVPGDGLGLNPILRDGGMLIHPPFQLAGYSSFAVPFGFAIASLLAGRHDAAWIAQTRRVALISWGLQSCGLLLGMWWAYHVLGWGGYFGWDPVENVALLPWLAVTAYLHSVQVQERRGRLKAWNLGLVILAFLLSVFGTFIVRSGIVPSVHTFALSPLGPWFFGFLAACVFGSGIVLASRTRLLRPDRPMPQAVSREGAYLVQNVLLVLLIAAIMWGTLLPLLSSLVGGQLVVGAPYYERTAGPLLALVLALLAVGPLLPWRVGRAWARRLRWPGAAWAVTLVALLVLGVRGAGPLIALPLIMAGIVTCVSEYVRGGRIARRVTQPWPSAALRLLARNRRRYGAHLTHIGLLALAIGIAGSHFWQQETTVVLRPGQTAHVAGYALTYESAWRQPQGDHEALTTRLRLGDGEVLQPARLIYSGQGGAAVTRIAIRSTPMGDLYVVYTGSSGDRAAFNVFVNPLVPWIWAGGFLLVLGVVLGNLGRMATVPAPEPRVAADGARSEPGVAVTAP
jgi:cytochrome c-type biogenesis protein CcmF